MFLFEFEMNCRCD